MKVLIMAIMLSSLVGAQQPALEQRDTFSIIANVDSVHHFYPKGGGMVSVISINSGAANNSLMIYLVVANGDGPDAVAKIWSLDLRCARIMGVKLLPSEKGVQIDASVDFEGRDSNRGKLTNRSTAYSVSWESVSALAGTNGSPALPPSVKRIEKSEVKGSSEKVK